MGSLAHVGVFQLMLRLNRELEDKKQWLQLTVGSSCLKQLFLLLDQMVTYASGEVRRQGMLLRRNVFYEGEVMKLLETLVKAYEPFRMPSSYMADCVTMTHAVLNQLEGFAADGSMVVSRRKKKKKKAAAAAAGGELPEGGAAAEADDDADAEAEAEAETFAEEVEFDFEKALYDFAHQHAVIERCAMGRASDPTGRLTSHARSPTALSPRSSRYHLSGT